MNYVREKVSSFFSLAVHRDPKENVKIYLLSIFSIWAGGFALWVLHFPNRENYSLSMGANSECGWYLLPHPCTPCCNCVWRLMSCFWRNCFLIWIQVSIKQVKLELPLIMATAISKPSSEFFSYFPVPYTSAPLYNENQLLPPKLLPLC